MFNNFLDYSYGAILIIALMLVTSFMFVFVYYLFNKDNFNRNYAISLVILPLIISFLIVGVSTVMDSVTDSGNYYERALAALLAGLLIVRYRSKNIDVLDLTYIFFMMAYSFIMGLGYLYFGLVFFVVIFAVMILINFINSNEKAYILKITVPEDLNFENAFDEILNKYCKKHKLYKVKSENMGTTFVLSYELVGNCNMKDMLDEIRIKNGNMNVMLTKKLDNFVE